MESSFRRRPKRVLPARAVRSQYQRRRGAASKTPLVFQFDRPDDINLNGEGEDCELRAYDYRTDIDGQRISLRSALSNDNEDKKDRAFRSALVFRRDYSMTNELESVELEIRSPYIQNALRSVIKSYPGTSISTESTGRIILRDEPRCLFHFRDELQTYADNSGDAVIESHLGLCLRYMRRSLREHIASYDVTMASSSPSLEHHLLWMAFKPGQLLYQNIEGVEVLSRLRSIYLDRGALVHTNKALQYRHWIVEAETLKCDGTSVGFIHRIVPIYSYEGCQPLVSLPICPVHFHPEKQRISDDALLRGRTYLSLLHIHHRHYDGLAKFCPYGPTNDTRWQKHSEIRHRIIIDCQKFQSDCRVPKVEFIPAARSWQTASDEHLTISDEDALLCDPWIQGYSLVNKSWGHFMVVSIKEVEFNSDALKHLLLDQDKKDLVSALVGMQEDSDPSTGFDDLIEGKGKGLTFLLHGPPGVGKTLTAESIAERTQRPLLTINSGQIIGPAPWVEHRLGDLLNLATRWKALVLIDEADVFMQERTAEELERNGLVSCLLRMMEYFEGILFLTTNRFEVIDSAFKSRIHLAISYPHLTSDSRKQLWRNLIVRACNDRLPRWATERFLKKVAQSEVNGREIKNIVRMAHGIARAGERSMRSEDVFKGIAALELFDKDIKRSKSQIETDPKPNEPIDRHGRGAEMRNRGFLGSYSKYLLFQRYLGVFR